MASIFNVTLINILGFICFALSAAAVGLPLWGYFEDSAYGFGSEKGYFGLWKVCREMNYGREKCGSQVSKFRLSGAVFFSGILAVVSCIMLGVFCILSIIQIAMVSSREKVVMKYSTIVILKLIIAIVAALLSVIVAVVFAIQSDSRSGFFVSRGPSFYMELIAVVLNIFLVLAALYDLMYSRRTDGDPTVTPDVTGQNAITYDNPGYREGEHNKAIAMTHASGRPYAGSASGSLNSMNTTVTTMSNGSSISSRNAPLRSSLKKPRVKDDFGIQNPGFAPGNRSPTSFERKPSVKKVRIVTQSTEV